MTEKLYGGDKKDNKTVLVNFTYRSLTERGWGGDEDNNIYVPDYRSASMQTLTQPETSLGSGRRRTGPVSIGDLSRSNRAQVPWQH